MSKKEPAAVPGRTSHIYAAALVAEESVRAQLDIVEDAIICLTRSHHIESFTDFLIEYFDRLRERTLLRFAIRLARCEHTPLRLALYMVENGPATAAPFLRESKVLSQTDLLYIVKSKRNPAYNRMIAQRDGLSPALAKELKATGDAQINSVLDHISPDVEGPREDITNSFKASWNIIAPLEVVEMINSSFSDGQISADEMVKDLQNDDIDSFIRRLSARLGCTAESVGRALWACDTHDFIHLLRDADLDRSEFVAIYLLVQRCRSQEMMIDPDTLKLAVDMFQAHPPCMTRIFKGAGRVAA